MVWRKGFSLALACVVRFARVRAGSRKRLGRGVGLLLRNGLQLGGVACVVAGVWMVFPPAAWVAAGAWILLYERGIGRGESDDS